MSDPLDNQDQYGGLAQDLLGKTFNVPPPFPGLGATLMQGVPAAPVFPGAMPAAGRLLGHVPNAAPPASGDMAAPIKAGSEGNADPTSQEIGQEMIEGQRPNLGWPNSIRDLLPRGFSRDMFDNYILGKGDYQLSPGRFQDIVDTTARLRQPPSNPVYVTGLNGEPLQRVTYNFSSAPDYARSLGSASLFYDGAGNPVGFYDDYNFDPAVDKRKLWPEIETRAVHAVHPFLPATTRPFQIRYGLYPPP